MRIRERFLLFLTFGTHFYYFSVSMCALLLILNIASVPPACLFEEAGCYLHACPVGCSEIKSQVCTLRKHHRPTEGVCLLSLIEALPSILESHIDLSSLIEGYAKRGSKERLLLSDSKVN